MTSTTTTRTARPATKKVAVKKAVAPKAAPKKAVAKKVVDKKEPKAIAQPVQAAKHKPKLVRDSFTIPKSEYVLLEALKQRAAELKRPTKKSELLRAGISALHGMSDKVFLTTLNRVPSLKTGRPAKNNAG